MRGVGIAPNEIGLETVPVQAARRLRLFSGYAMHGTSES
jgi:hypothetical protein